MVHIWLISWETGVGFYVPMFHITHLRLGDISFPTDVCFGDAQALCNIISANLYSYLVFTGRLTTVNH